ncbi:MAG TPA: hypothetical protein VME22_08775 [Solirubrobacteraceae bacterium]|nr:hypothetical protein [Solirubrobacteraceae bacterium]
MPEERWFAPEELDELCRPTMDRAIEALHAGDTERAIELCEGMKHEWRFLHDLMAESMLGLITYIQEAFGEERVAEAWERTLRRGWRRQSGKILERDRREIVEALAATWRAHSTSGVGPEPGAFTIEEDEEKFTFRMNPCGSGQRLWRLGMYAGDDPYGVTREAHDWSYHRAGLPLYCTHCTFMNELLPIRWYGLPLYPSEPPGDYDRDPCTWYWYKDPADIPQEHWSRYGLERARPGSDG